MAKPKKPALNKAQRNKAHKLVRSRISGKSKSGVGRTKTTGQVVSRRHNQRQKAVGAHQFHSRKEGGDGHSGGTGATNRVRRPENKARSSFYQNKHGKKWKHVGRFSQASKDKERSAEMRPMRRRERMGKKHGTPAERALYKKRIYGDHLSKHESGHRYLSEEHRMGQSEMTTHLRDAVAKRALGHRKGDFDFKEMSKDLHQYFKGDTDKKKLSLKELERKVYNILHSHDGNLGSIHARLSKRADGSHGVSVYSK